MAEEAPLAGAQAPAPPCQRCPALQAELEAVKAERDFLREELRERRETAARFLAALEKRRREACEQEDDSEPERRRLQ
jgi:hypothetical protein